MTRRGHVAFDATAALCTFTKMDVQKLIEMVREHIYLYDLNHEQYKDATLKAATWESIGRELNETGEAARNKWKTIRDGYTKYKKQLKTSTGSNRKNCRYTWAPQLAFLDDFNVPRGSSSNVSLGLDNPPQQTPALDFDDLHNTLQWNSSQLSSTSSQIPPSYEFQLPPDSPGNTLTSRASYRKKRRSPENRRDDDDEDENVDDVGRVFEIVNSKKRKVFDVVDNLFLSYADTFKKFPAREQAIVKLELAKLFANTELQLLDKRSTNGSLV